MQLAGLEAHPEFHPQDMRLRHYRRLDTNSAMQSLYVEARKGNY